MEQARLNRYKKSFYWYESLIAFKKEIQKQFKPILFVIKQEE
jgi:hypothetical protein